MKTQIKSQLTKTLQRVRNQLSEIEAAERKRENEKLIGKCFKYRNCYSCPTKESDYWFIYTFVQRADADGGIRQFSFETTADNRIEIRLDHWNISLISGYVEIPASELESAWLKVLRSLLAVDPPR